MAALLSAAAAHADEGMWTLYNLPTAVYEQMKGYGFDRPYEDLYASDNAIMKSVVNFSGYCSGVVVSPDGLVLTNHHCGFESIRSHSTVEHDYMLNGFYAKSFEEELPNDDMFVSFMVSQKDITPQLESLGIQSMNPKQQAILLDSIENAMAKEVHKQDSTLRLEVKPFYEGNKYYATTYRDYNDLRLVFAVPKSMGKFGGETDNWMWPRQTCDFSVFRIYVDPKTGGPANYSKDNVPFHPEHWTQVSLDGYKDGDFAMTVGYPGSTERYLSSYGIRQMRDCENQPRAQVRGVKQQVMWRHMTADEAVRIKYDSKYAQSSNYWKNSIGMNKCIDSIGLVNQKREFEDKIRAWQDSTGYLKGRLDFDRMAKLYGEAYQLVRERMLLMETFRRTSEFNVRAMLSAGTLPAENPKASAQKQYFCFDDNSSEWDEALDKEVMAVLIDNLAKQLPKDKLPKFYDVINSQFGGNSTAYVDYLYANSCLMKSGEKLYFNRKKFAQDPGVAYGKAIKECIDSVSSQMKPLRDSIAVLEKYLCDAKVRMEEDLPHYSDANFTMRLSYGQVGGYEIGGNLSGYYTTAESIVSKMQSGSTIVDYAAEPIMQELLSAPDFGRYQDKTTGKMQLCFLTNNDITGGNSGSPIFNGNGELIGLAFDGNWDSLSSDIHFDRVLARCIGVDIRYVLYLMDKWGHADRLLKELGVEK